MQFHWKYNISSSRQTKVQHSPEKRYFPFPLWPYIVNTLPFWSSTIDIIFLYIPRCSSILGTNHHDVLSLQLDIITLLIQNEWTCWIVYNKLVQYRHTIKWSWNVAVLFSNLFTSMREMFLFIHQWPSYLHGEFTIGTWQLHTKIQIHCY